MVSDLKSDFARDDRDTERILALNESEYGPASLSPSTDVVSTRESFLWRRDQNPAGRAVIPVVRDQHGEVAGFIWLIPLRIRARGQNYMAAAGANLLISPESRGTSGYVKLMRKFSQALKDSGAALHYSFVSEGSHKRLRIDNPQTSFTVPLAVKPLDSRALIQSRFPSPWKRTLAVAAAWIAAPAFFRRPLLHPNLDIAIHAMDHFDDSFDTFWSQVENKYRAITIRDRAFLRWRFSPVDRRRYHVLVARLKDQTLGYAVLRCATVRGVSTGLMLDLLLLANHHGQQAGIRLAAEAEEFFRSQKMAVMLTMLAPGSAESQVLGWLGWRRLGHILNPRRLRFAFFVQDAYGQGLQSLSVQDWFISLADFESL